MSKDKTYTVSAKVAIDTRKDKANEKGEYPICIKVIYKRTIRFYRIGKFYTEPIFEAIQNDKTTATTLKLVTNKLLMADVKIIRKDFNQELSRANTIIDKLGDDFTFTRFRAKFKGDTTQAKAYDLYGYFEKVIDEKKADSTKTTYKVYENALSNLKSFHKSKLEFKEIDYNFLKRYEKWFLTTKHGQKVKKFRSETSLSIYLRTLRSVLNSAISDGLMKPEQYPFAKGDKDKRKFKIPSPRNIKKALTKEQVRKIIDYKPENEAEAYHRDIWLFSYLCNGMNFKDIALLKYENVADDGIVFVRAKTRGKTQDPIFVPLLEQSKAIIERWGNPDKKPENRVFDLIPENTTDERFVYAKNQRIKILNKYLRRIFKKLDLGEYQGLYSARHSYATVMKRSGVSIESISESLGHSSVLVTKNYLDSFEKEHKVKEQQYLV